MKTALLLAMALAIAAFPSVALSPGVQQQGTLVPSHRVTGYANGVVQDGGVDFTNSFIYSNHGASF